MRVNLDVHPPPIGVCVLLPNNGPRLIHSCHHLIHIILYYNLLKEADYNIKCPLCSHTRLAEATIPSYVKKNITFYYT